MTHSTRISAKAAPVDAGTVLPDASDSPAAPIRQFVLSGPAADYDPRVTAIRGDLADIALAGRFFAPHYVAPQIHRVLGDGAMLRNAGASDAEAVSQLLPGEAFALLDSAGDWAWGYGGHDGYCGYLPLDALTGDAPAPTHVVHARRALVFAEPSIKTPMLAAYPMGARVTVLGTSECGKFWQLAEGWMSVRHAIALEGLGCDPVDRALQLVGAPYLWGGRGGEALDCSGLVQLVLALAGHNAPRDSDQQMAALGRALADDEPFERGDLVFFPGHVGIMMDAEMLIHANAHWMQVVAEPLADVIARFPETTPQPVLARKRIG
ncbi:NlpC/P60 family protein [Blastomonas sp. AAP53]|uniref:C40 family peptidase n=1 Tax=Blastomonas sp. AAP53 TaxID=1248760 RepID=UPI00030BA1CF|nr:NlpC/P60 family protein [Blastomonas sp. AAP53]